MRILIEILHPAHVHFFRPFIAAAEERGHEIRVTARDKDVTRELLDTHGIPYRLLSRQRRGMGLAFELFWRGFRLIREAKRWRPDVLVSIMGPTVALARPFLRARAIALYDNESAGGINRVVHGLCDVYLTPQAFTQELGSRQRRYPGCHELAYLHPDRFEPDPRVAERLGFDIANERLFVLRFVAWDSAHDVGESGFSLEGKRRLVNILRRHGRVTISSEAPLPDDLAPFAFPGPADAIHHVLACADLFVGESSTMASEACLLGTRAVYVSRTGRGVNDEQARIAGLLDHYDGRDEAAIRDRVKALLAWPDLKDDARVRRQTLLTAYRDPVAVLLEAIEEVAPKSGPRQ